MSESSEVQKQILLHLYTLSISLTIKLYTSIYYDVRGESLICNNCLSYNAMGCGGYNLSLPVRRSVSLLVLPLFESSHLAETKYAI